MQRKYCLELIFQYKHNILLYWSGTKLIPLCAFTSISLFSSFVSVMPFFLLQTSKVIAHAVPSTYLLRFAGFLFYMDPFPAKCNFDFTVRWGFLLPRSHITMQLINCSTVVHQQGKLPSWWFILEHQGAIPTVCWGLAWDPLLCWKNFWRAEHVLPT